MKSNKASAVAGQPASKASQIEVGKEKNVHTTFTYREAFQLVKTV